MLADVSNALTFIRLGRIVAADFSRHLSYDLFVRPFDGEFGVFVNSDLDLIRYVKKDRVRKAQCKVELLALDGGLEADAMNLELFHVSFTNAFNHVVD